MAGLLVVPAATPAAAAAAAALCSGRRCHVEARRCKHISQVDARPQRVANAPCRPARRPSQGDAIPTECQHLPTVRVVCGCTHAGEYINPKQAKSQLHVFIYEDVATLVCPPAPCRRPPHPRPIFACPPDPMNPQLHPATAAATQACPDHRGSKVRGLPPA